MESEGFDDNDGVDTVVFSLHAVCRTTIFNPSNDASIYLWAAPDMTQYLMYGDDLLTAKFRSIKETFLTGVPHKDYVDHVMTDSNMKTKANEMIDGGYSWPTAEARNFCWIYFNLIVGSAIHGRASPCSLHDGKGIMRQSDVAEVALRRALQLWSDTMVQKACNDAIGPGASLALTAVSQYGSIQQFSQSGGELAPGLTIDSATLAIINELRNDAFSRSYSAQLALLISKMPSSLWGSVGVDRRASVALALVTYLYDIGERGLKDDDDCYVHMPKEFSIKTLYEILDATSDTNDSSLRLSIWERAASHDDLGPEGRGYNYFARAFFHFLMQQTQKRADKDPLMVNMKSAMLAWDIMPWPPAKATSSSQMVAAEVKSKCLALVMGFKIFEIKLKRANEMLN